MRLENFKLLHEDEHAFHLHDGKSQLTVAKRGLGKGLIDKITQHFSEGGRVADRAEAEAAAGMLGVDPLPTSLPDPADPGLPAPTGYDPTPTHVSAADAAEADAAAGMAGPRILPTTPAVAAPSPAQAAPVQNGPPFPDPAGLAVPAPAPAAPRPGGSGGALDAQLAKAEKDREAALRSHADVAAREAEAIAHQQAQNEAQRQAFEQKRAQQFETQQARGERLFNDIASSKIEPNRLWNSASTGQKLSASIGMILGGIGAAITRGPNYAIQVVDSAIQRDLDGQKAELGKKESLLAHHLQQGHALMEAQQLAKADMLDGFAANIAKTATGFVGEKAKTEAALAIAASRSQATVLRQEVQARGLQMDMTRAQIAAQQRAALGAGSTGDVAAAIAKGDSADALSGPGVKLSPEIHARLSMDKELGPRLVSTPEGKTALAKTPEAAKDYAKLTTKIGHYQDLIEQARKIHKANPHGGTPFTADVDRAKSIEAGLVETAGEIQELTRLTGEEVKLRDVEIPHLADFRLNPARASAVLDELQNSVNSRLRHAGRGFLVTK